MVRNLADEGGTAFPASELGTAGMTLRDYFAAQALAGGFREFLTTGDSWDDYDDFAKSCYAMADAMLKARRQA